MTAPRTDIFLFVDALGWDIVGREDFLKSVLPYRKAVTMQFGYSCTAIPTILSGTRPDVHGHLGLFRFAPNESPFGFFKRFGSLMHPKSFWNRGRVRHWLSKAVKRFLGWTGYFQLYQMTPEKLPYMDYCEKENLFVPHGLGNVENLADILERSGLSYHISDWHLSDGQNLDIGMDEVKKGTQFIFLYTAELDSLRHDCANEASFNKVKPKLDWYRQRIEALAECASKSGRPWSLTVFSDHGMTPLTKTIDLKSAVEATGLKFGEDYGACYDSTMLRVNFLKPEAKDKLMEALKPFEADGHWLSQDEEKTHGIFREDKSFGDAIFLANPGIQIVPSDMGLKPLNGMHGFAPADQHSLAAIMSTEPIPEYLNGVYDYFHLMKEKINGNQN